MKLLDAYNDIISTVPVLRELGYSPFNVVKHQLQRFFWVAFKYDLQGYSWLYK